MHGALWEAICSGMQCSMESYHKIVKIPTITVLWSPSKSSCYNNDSYDTPSQIPGLFEETQFEGRIFS